MCLKSKNILKYIMAKEAHIFQLIILIIIIQSILSKPTSLQISSNVILYTEKVNSNITSLSETQNVPSAIKQTEKLPNLDLESSSSTNLQNLNSTSSGNGKNATSSAQKSNSTTTNTTSTSGDDTLVQTSPKVSVPVPVLQIKDVNANETDILSLKPFHGQSDLSEHLQQEAGTESLPSPENISNGEDNDNERKLYNPKVPDPPLTEKDRIIREMWGGNCASEHWNRCSRIKTWGGTYYVEDKKNPGKQIEKFYSIKCFSNEDDPQNPEEKYFCLHNGWTVARCHLLCMSQCNNDYRLKYDKFVSHEGICALSIG